MQLTDPKLNRAYTMGMTPGPSAQDERRFAARVLSDVIGDSDGCRFYWALVDNAIAEDADFGFYPHDACGSFYIALTTDPERARTSAGHRAGGTGSREERPERRRSRARQEQNRQQPRPLRRSPPRPHAHRSAASGSTTSEYRSLEQDMATLMSVNRQSLLDLLHDFPFDPMTLVTLGPTEAKS